MDAFLSVLLFLITPPVLALVAIKAQEHIARENAPLRFSERNGMIIPEINL